MANTLLTGLAGDGNRGHGDAHYRGEGGIASAGAYHNALEPFLGPPSKRIDAQPHHKFPHEAWFLPDAYGGRNEYIRETIVHLVTSFNSFMTTEILPWKEQDNPNIAWDSIRFDKTLVDMEPEQGVPRYVTVQQESHSDFMVRRGLALIVNHGFAATPGGQKDFMYKVATIVGAVQETCDQAGVMALLRAKNEYQSHVIEDMRTASDAYDLFHHEIWRWGIIQHTDRGWYHMDAEAQHVMRSENIQPDTWIVPPRMTSFAAMGQMAETEVWRAGETTARANLNRGEDNFTSFRGKAVYEVKPYQLDVDGRTVDPLNRSRMIGDFFIVPYYDVRRDGDGPMYPVPRRGRTQVYCCDSDRFETFCWEDMHAESKFHELQSLGDVLSALNPGGVPGDIATSSKQDALQFIVGLQLDKYLHAQNIKGKGRTGVEIAAMLADAAGAAGAGPDAAASRRRWDEMLKKIPAWLKPYVDDALDDDPSGRNFHAIVGNAPEVHTRMRDRCKSAITVSVPIGPRLPSNSKFGAAHFCGSRFGPQTEGAATDKVKEALAMGLLKQFPDLTQVDDATQAAQAYAKPLTVVGIEPALAAAAMLESLHHHVAGRIHASAVEGDIAMAPALDVHDAYVQGGVDNGYLTVALEQAVPAAFKAATQSGAEWAIATGLNAPGVHIGADVALVHNDVRYVVHDTPKGTIDEFAAMQNTNTVQTYTYSQREMAALYHYERALNVDAAESSVERKRFLCPDFLKSILEVPGGAVHGEVNGMLRRLTPILANNAFRDDYKQRSRFGANVHTSRRMLLNAVALLESENVCYVYSFKAMGEVVRNATVVHPAVLAVAGGAGVLAITTLDNLQETSYGAPSSDIDLDIDMLMVMFYLLDQAAVAALTAPWVQAADAVAGGAPPFVAVPGLSELHAFPFAARVNAGVNTGDQSYWAFNTVTYVHSEDEKVFSDFQVLDPFNQRRTQVQDRFTASPYDLLCYRPFRQYVMGTGVLCKKGSELGNTFRGWADFQLTDNIIAKTHIGHFTFWHASVVTNAKCLFLAEDIFCTNYEGGEGRGVLPWSQVDAFREDPMGTMRKNNASIICVPVPVGAINPVDRRLATNNPLSLTGVLDPGMRAKTGQQSACMVHLGDYAAKGKSGTVLEDLRQMWMLKRNHLTSNGQAHQLARFQATCPCPPRPVTIDHHIPGQLSSDIIDQIWGFSDMNHEVDYEGATTFETSGRLVNTICFHTMQKFQNPSNLRWEVTNLNTGHFGENGIYEGVKKIRCGFLDYFKNMDYAKAMAMGGLNI